MPRQEQRRHAENLYAMKFIADAMLGRLAKLLRLIGIDVLYYPDIDDNLLIRIAREQDRTVLTRDLGLLRRKALKDYIFITSDDTFAQLEQIISLCNLTTTDTASRCTVCNSSLTAVTRKKEIKEQVPDYIYHNINNFFTCDVCGKVYWKGTHYAMFTKKLNKLLSGSKKA